MAWTASPSAASSTKKYSSFWFHGFRFIQFITSGTVAGVMIFFVHHLRDSHIKIPWMFFLLQGAALTTILWLAVSSLLQYWHRLSPLINAIVNGFTGCVWIGAFGLLAYRMGSLTVRGCSTEIWGTDQGVLVCQLYKLLFSAAVVAIAATICAFILDIRTLHPKDSRGAYGRAITDQQGKEPLMHKSLPKGFATEETQYLRPDANEQLYDPGSNTPSAPLRSLSPAANSDGGHTPDALQAGRRGRSASPGVSRWRELE
ncbi:hypothetical protein BKA66DRAFT_539456 [Pyrenochaeta sp. MPI-SDFR-AT-0127]|nr:hypothetical protein BKA66DRAFT_539456 [Pyrenochaeta sp. MPI-SDFR-AT-0127]